GGPRTIFGMADEPVPVAAALGRYLYEPHNAVLAATLAAAICREHALAAVSPGIAYLTGDRLVHDAALAAFEVREILPFDVKKLKAWCREHRIGQLEVKKRGVELEPEKLRRQLVSDGDRSATLIVTMIGGKARVVVCHRVEGNPDSEVRHVD